MKPPRRPARRPRRPADAQLRTLISESGLPLKNLATAAGVRYFPLWKWATRRQEHYNLLDAELVYYHLTGKTFLPQ